MGWIMIMMMEWIGIWTQLADYASFWTVELWVNRTQEMEMEEALASNILLHQVLV